MGSLKAGVAAGMSGRLSDNGLDPEMNVFMLIVRFTTGERHDLLLSTHTMLFDHGVVNMSAIHTP
jgi:hypothetical protein